MSSVNILAGLTAIANDWRGLAIAWHVVLAVVLLLLATGWRLSTRVLGHLLVMPLLSVSLLAWLSGSLFNGTTFAALAGVLTWGAPYLYSAPFGLLPCPILSVVIGMTLLVHSLRSSSWNTPLVVAGLLYGAVGSFQLGVTLDWALLFASAALVLYGSAAKPSVRADFAERVRVLPGDEFILSLWQRSPTPSPSVVLHTTSGRGWLGWEPAIAPAGTVTTSWTTDGGAVRCDYFRNSRTSRSARCSRRCPTIQRAFPFSPWTRADRLSWVASPRQRTDRDVGVRPRGKGGPHDEADRASSRR